MKCTNAQKKVIDTAKMQLENETWFKGVCLNKLPNDGQIKQDFESAVAQVVAETHYWDNPAVWDMHADVKGL